MSSTPTQELLTGLLAFLVELDKLKLVERRSYVARGVRRENSAEHSWHVAIAGWMLSRQAGVALDLEHLLKLAIAHDLGEIDAGDVPIYAATRRERPAEEAACVERLRGLAPDVLGELPALWLEYEDQQTLESQWVKVADRLLPFLHNLASSGKTWREQGVRRGQVLHVQQPVARTYPELFRWIEAQSAEAVTKGWLRGDSDPAPASPAPLARVSLNDLGQITLRGREVELRPLALDDAPALAAAAAEGRDHYAYTPVPATVADATAYIEQALSMRRGNTRYPFCLIWQGRVVGSTSYCDCEWFDWPAGSTLANAHGPDALEIGYTWLAASAQRTRCNTEAKYLLLRHAFDSLQVHRARLRADARNARSRAAIERLGARFDGVLRGDLAGSDGTLRDSAFYSILRDDWPAIARELEQKLGA